LGEKKKKKKRGRRRRRNSAQSIRGSCKNVAPKCDIFVHYVLKIKYAELDKLCCL
jgi:hypothetical protein